jgi:transporter family protein
MELSWIIFALLSALSASLVAIFGKIGLQELDSTAATTIRAGIMFLFLIFVILFTGKLSNVSAIFSNHRAIFYIFLSGVAGAVSWLFYFFALKIGKASQVAPIDRLSIVFVIIFAALVLGEKITLKSAIGTALMVLGAVFIALT